MRYVQPWRNKATRTDLPDMTVSSCLEGISAGHVSLKIISVMTDK